MMKSKNNNYYILLEILAVCFLATGGIWVKLSPLPPITTGFYRILFSLPILFFPAYKKAKTISKKDFLILFLAGAFLAGDISLWNVSFGYTTVANANLLANMTPFTVIPISYFIFKEKVPRMFFLGTGITLIGLMILLGGKVAITSDSYFGDLLAFLTSFFYAAFLLISYRMRQHISSSVIMFISGLGGCVTLMCTSAAIEGLHLPSAASDLLPAFGLTCCLQVIGHNLLTHCQKNVNVNLSSIICLIQPVIASVYSYLLFGETLALPEILGIVIVIFGVYLVKRQF